MLEKYIEISKIGISKLPSLSGNDIKETNINELHEIIIGKYADIALDVMEKDGILSLIIPGLNDVTALVDKSGKNRFKDLWWHTKLVVKQSKPKLEIRWAALFHDFGKPSCLSVVNNKIVFHGHEKASVKYFKEFARVHKIFTKEQYNKICFLIYNLGYVESYSTDWSESAVRRFAKDMGEHVWDILLLSRADVTSSKKENRENVQKHVSELGKRIKAVQAKDAIKPVLPKGLGNAIIDIGYPDGPIIGQIKKYLEQKIKNNDISPNMNIEYYIDYLKETGMQNDT